MIEKEKNKYEVVFQEQKVDETHAVRAIAIIDTPLELLHFLNFQESTEYGNMQWDLMYMENASSDHDLFLKITDAGLFNNTFFLFDAWKNYKAKTEQGIQWYFTYLNKTNVFKIWPNIPKNFYDYNYMLFCTHAGYSICNFAYHYNKKLKFIWLEDGMTTYVNYGDFFPNKSTKSLIKNILLHNYGKKKVECQYLYHPELANYSVPCTRYKLQSLKPNSRTAKISDDLFGVSEKDFIKQNFIYFDNAFASFGMNINDGEILKYVRDTIGNENLTIKVHPRNDPNKYIEEGYNVNIKRGVPWESYFFHTEAVSHKILIGVISTALLSPFLYFDSKQKVISLIRFLDMDSIEPITRKYIEAVRDIFMASHPDIFLLPKTNQELIDVLLKIQKSEVF